MTTNGNGEAEVMTAREVSEFLRIPLSTLYGLAKRGQIKGVKVGKHWRYLRSDISACLQGAGPSNSQDSIPRRDRRGHPRINCEIPAALLMTLSRSSGHEKKMGIQNLCEGGVFLVDGDMAFGLHVGDPVSVAFEVPQTQNGNGNPQAESKKIRSEGRVIRMDACGGHSLAVKFRGLGPEDREAIRDYVG